MYLHGGVGIPNLLWCGIQKNYNILIMELLGKSLEDLLNLCQRKFQLKTVLMIADQILKRIEYIHNRNFIIRDMKPQNFLIGLEKEKRNTIYAIDFGIAKRYRDPKTGLHINYKEGCDLMGCARFASINALLGIEQSRRDDIEAFGYMMVYLAKGTLPWIGLRAKNMKEKYRKLKERKIETNLIDLCHGLPDELKIIINYAREIQFEDKPDYNLIKKLIKSAMDRNKIKNDQKFEWNQILEEEDKKNILFLDLKDDEKDNE
jgi:serine/threonine protein kinase